MSTFRGRTLAEIMRQIRADLGDDAVVLSQRQVVTGGVGGFFGKREIEIVAADRMPSDDELVDLEATGYDTNVYEDAPAAPAIPAAGTTNEPARPGRFIDVTDDWNPSADSIILDPLSARGDVTADVEPMIAGPRTSAPQFTAFDLPDLSLSTNEPAGGIATAPVAAPVATAPPRVLPPAAQAQRLVARTHRHLRKAAERVDASLTVAAQPTVEGQGGWLISSQATTHDGVSEQVAAPTSPVLDPVWTTLRSELESAGVDADVAAAVITKVTRQRLAFAPSGSARSLLNDVIAEHLLVDSGWSASSGYHAIALVGASGTGKSTTAAKIAESYARTTGEAVTVVVISAPGSQGVPGAHPLLGRPGLDVRFVSEIAQAAEIGARLRESGTLVIVDTPGSAYQDPHLLAHVRSCIVALSVEHVHLVVPLATGSREASSLVRHFADLRVDRLIVSKVDESSFSGQFLNFGFRFGLPITFVSDGPSVPEDIRAASARELANSIIAPDKEENSWPS